MTDTEQQDGTPERERLVHQDPALAARIREGIAEAEAGQTADLGSFAQYLPDLFNEYPALAPIVGEIVGTRVRTTDTQDIADMHLYPVLAEAGVRVGTQDERDQAIGLLAAMVDQVKVLIAAPIPGFFESGQRYVEDHPYRAPEVLRVFDCLLVTLNPNGTGGPVAFGFGRTGVADGMSTHWGAAVLGPDHYKTGWIKQA